jgi:aminomethyltransferase
VAESRRGPLDALHRALGAKMVPFGGWEMPLAYGSGTVAEHFACRRDAVIFDVSHLGTVRVLGPSAKEQLQRALTNDLDKIAPGRAQYTHLLADDASVLDDIIVWWVSDERFDVMPNASNTDNVVAAIGGEDVTATRAVFAVQGPRAKELVAAYSPDLAAIGRFRVAEIELDGVSCVVAGTGYTGEPGFEVAVPVAHAARVWEAIVATGVTPAGLGARDTLRLEAGLPLHGHELGAGITPLQASLGWVVAWNKPAFRGKDALVAEREAGVARELRGIVCDSRRPPRDGCDVLIDGRRVGVVSSGNFSPVLECGIALAFLEPGIAVDTAVSIDVRGTLIDGRVVQPPFVTTSRA